MHHRGWIDLSYDAEGPCLCDPIVRRARATRARGSAGLDHKRQRIRVIEGGENSTKPVLGRTERRKATSVNVITAHCL